VEAKIENGMDSGSGYQESPPLMVARLFWNEIAVIKE